jgi:2'-hydroxyisoflavone reductase
VRLLVLGGTQFVGRALVEAALAGGDAVTLFHRGQTNPDLFPQAEHVLGDRDGGLDALAEREWDACIDVSGYLPRLVRDSARLLLGRVPRYVFVSTISVYADLAVPRDESGPLATIEDATTEEILGGAYGALKALCEQEVTAAYGEAAAIVRPGFVIGPHDHTGRFPWWAHRAGRGGEMIVPASLSRAFQAIDARDLADFLLLRARSSLTGVFNATGPLPPVTLLDLVEAAAGASDADLNVEVVDDAFLTAQGVAGELPLWSDDPLFVAWAEVDVRKAIGAGLTFRPVADTVEATLAHSPAVAGVGLDPAREAELLARWRAR